MRELDYLLLPFYEKHIEGLSSEDLELLSEILNLSDPELHALLVSELDLIPSKFKPIISKIKFTV